MDRALPNRGGPNVDGPGQWAAFVDELASAGADVHRTADAGRSLEEQTQVTQSMLWTLVGELDSLANIDRDHPAFKTILSNSLRRFNANADNLYEVAYIRGGGTYRVTGRRGTTRLMHLQVGAGMLGIGDAQRHTMMGDLNIDTCVADDGTFEVILSARRPEGYAGAWLQLDPSRDDSFVWVRHVSYDWLNEIDGQVAIERIDIPIAKKDPTSSDMTANLIEAARAVRDDSVTMLRMMNEQLEMSEVNQFADVSARFQGIVGQAYTHGLIQIADDEAWVAECTIPPDCPYWSVQLMDYAYSALDAMYTQSSLNGHTAAADPDGVHRIVVAATDPGVANWLDTSGHRRVQIRFRWFDSAAPAINVRVIRLEDLQDALPADTIRVTPAERQDALRRRAVGLQWRRR